MEWESTQELQTRRNIQQLSAVQLWTGVKMALYPLLKMNPQSRTNYETRKAVSFREI